MKITFIDPTQSVTNYGLRALSQYLVNANHEVKMVFMNQSSIQYDYDYPESIYEDLFQIVKDSDIIGISFVSNYLGHSKCITKKLKNKFGKPIIWGGIHAIAAPEQSLEIADMVCVGEGEECMISLLEKMETGGSLHEVPNLWFREDDIIVRNPTAPINPNIDDYSMPLYDNTREFVRQGNNIVPMKDSIRKQIIGVTTNYYNIEEKTTYPYLTLASRGCPNICSYCCNNLFRRIYKGKGKILRRRSNREIISELEKITRQIPYINVIEFFDDDFCFVDEETISEFARLYKQKINLPFRCNFRPESVTYEKLSLLCNAGVISVEMGLQSASARINRLFKRHFNKTAFMEAARIINKFEQIVPHYDIIVDNPFENYEDIKQTLRFISELPIPFRLAVYSLTFFPGTQLYTYAKENNLIGDEIKEIISKKNYVQHEFKQPYIKLLLLYIRRVGFKRSITRSIFFILTTRPLMMIFDSFLFYPIWFLILYAKRVVSKIQHKEIQVIPG